MNLHFKLADLFSGIVDLVILNLLFVLTSLPVFTIGASATALYSVTLRMVRGEESSIVKAYFHGFKQNFALATKGFLLLGVPSVLMLANLVISYGKPEAAMLVLFGASVFFLCIFGIFMVYYFPILARFQFTMKQIFQHIPHMIFTHFVEFLLILGVMGGAIALFLLKVKAAMIMLEFSFIIGWAGMAWIKSFFFRSVFDSYELEPQESQAGTSCPEASCRD